ncbi:MAG: pantetheine-phosphate adenylyltransferase [Chitinispirillales bacterium]|jgi:pantetheine-phosphate adenylyltransferase|nr:pantetheine-phosphate adenylyltransferase [Chitinispirillales bacterium]
MSIGLYPGTFDPITFGHIDIVIRASKIFTKVVVVIADNPNKKCLFSADERLNFAINCLKNYSNVEVIKYGGLVIDAVAQTEASTIIRGLRALSDFDYEFQMAFTNRQLNDNVETIFLMPSSQYTYLSSSLVKQLTRFGGNVDSFVAPIVADALKKKYKD